MTVVQRVMKERSSTCRDMACLTTVCAILCSINVAIGALDGNVMFAVLSTIAVASMAFSTGIHVARWQILKAKESSQF